MNYISCQTCRGTGFVKRTKQQYCINNPHQISSHYCYKCENMQEKLKGKYVLCKKCNGDGYLKLPKSSS